MGDRAVIAFENSAPSDTGIYLHGYGGPESVKAFLDAAKQLGIRAGEDRSHFFARFAQLVGNFFGGTTGLGIGPLNSLDQGNTDNGVYYINGRLDIVGRTYGTDMGPVGAAEVEEYEQILNTVLEINRPIFNND